MVENRFHEKQLPWPWSVSGVRFRPRWVQKTWKKSRNFSRFWEKETQKLKILTKIGFWPQKQSHLSAVLKTVFSDSLILSSSIEQKINASTGVEIFFVIFYENDLFYILIELESDRMSPRKSAKNGRNGADELNCLIFVKSQLIFEIYDKNYPRKKFFMSLRHLWNFRKFWNFGNFWDFKWQF